MIKQRESWVIKDWRVKSLLERHGFTFDHQHYWWYTTDCPVKFNESYVFPCGHAIASQGTSLAFAGYRGKQ